MSVGRRPAGYNWVGFHPGVQYYPKVSLSKMNFFLLHCYVTELHPN